MKKSLRSSNLIIRNAVFDDIGLLRDVYRRASLTVGDYRDLFAAHPEWLVWDDKMLPFTRVAVVNGRTGPPDVSRWHVYRTGQKLILLLNS